MMGNIQAIEVQIPHEVVQYWGWFLVFGIGLLALGIAAVVRSVLASVKLWPDRRRRHRSAWGKPLISVYGTKQTS